MCMHMINDPLYKYYIKDDKIEQNKDNMGYKVIKVDLEGLTNVVYDGSMQSKVQTKVGKQNKGKAKSQNITKSNNPIM